MNLESLKSLVSEVLEVSPEILQKETELESLENYDSLKVLTLMVALDDAGILVSQNDVANLKYYGDIEEIAKKKFGL